MSSMLFVSMLPMAMLQNFSCNVIKNAYHSNSCCNAQNADDSLPEHCDALNVQTLTTNQIISPDFGKLRSTVADMQHHDSFESLPDHLPRSMVGDFFVSDFSFSPTHGQLTLSLINNSVVLQTRDHHNCRPKFIKTARGGRKKVGGPQRKETSWNETSGKLKDPIPELPACTDTAHVYTITMFEQLFSSEMTYIRSGNHDVPSKLRLEMTSSTHKYNFVVDAFHSHNMSQNKVILHAKRIINHQQHGVKISNGVFNHTSRISDEIHEELSHIEVNSTTVRFMFKESSPGWSGRDIGCKLAYEGQHIFAEILLGLIEVALSETGLTEWILAWEVIFNIIKSKCEAELTAYIQGVIMEHLGGSVHEHLSKMNPYVSGMMEATNNGMGLSSTYAEIHAKHENHISETIGNSQGGELIGALKPLIQKAVPFLTDIVKHIMGAANINSDTIHIATVVLSELLYAIMDPAGELVDKGIMFATLFEDACKMHHWMENDALIGVVHKWLHNGWERVCHDNIQHCYAWPAPYGDCVVQFNDMDVGGHCETGDRRYMDLQHYDTHKMYMNMEGCPCENKDDTRSCRFNDRIESIKMWRGPAYRGECTVRLFKSGIGYRHLSGWEACPGPSTNYQHIEGQELYGGDCYWEITLPVGVNMIETKRFQGDLRNSNSAAVLYKGPNAPSWLQGQYFANQECGNIRYDSPNCHPYQCMNLADPQNPICREDADARGGVHFTGNRQALPRSGYE